MRPNPNQSSTDLTRVLNPAQLRAVMTVTGPVQVNAGAGVGKTGTIVFRTCHLISDLGVPPQQILLLTFTRRAAREMLDRAARRDPRCAKVDGGTFHSLGYRYLRENAAALGLVPSFTVLDSADARELVGRCAARLGFTDREVRFPEDATLQKVLSAATNRNRSVPEILAADYPHFLDFAPDIVRVGAEYEKSKMQFGTLDYDDLLVLMQRLLQEEVHRRRIADRYSHIMVDEYQDTNHLQADIANLLAKDHGNIFVVGDDAQTIFTFRGSDHANIMRFPEVWPHCEIVTLEDNYRSTQAILDLANAVHSNMPKKFPKSLRAATGILGEKPQLVVFQTDYEEAEWIAEQIKTAHDNGVLFNRQASLARSVYLLRPLEVALAKRRIPYAVFGGLKFSETAHVKDVVALLKIIANPKDQLAWMRALRMIRGIGTKRADQMAADFGGVDTLVDSCRRMQEFVMGKHAYSEGLGQLEKMLRAAGPVATDAKASYEIVLKFYQRHIPNLYDDYPDRLDDLEVIGQMLASSDSLDGFLAEMVIESPQRADRQARRCDPEEDLVTLSTIHSAKGLEWEDVYLVGVREGTLPSSRAANKQEQIDEEHRLTYVAVTRARTRLVMSMNMSAHGGHEIPMLSRFFKQPNVARHFDRISSSCMRPRLDGISPLQTIGAGSEKNYLNSKWWL